MHDFIYGNLDMSRFHATMAHHLTIDLRKYDLDNELNGLSFKMGYKVVCSAFERAHTPSRYGDRERVELRERTRGTLRERWRT